jgi:hypothetical protein
VAIFDQNGVLLGMAAVGTPLAAPWGVALAPASFGQFGGDLLVGNFSFLNSGINAFDPVTGMFEGTIPINVGAGNTPRRVMGAWFRDGLWQRRKSRYTLLLLHRWYRRRDPRAVWRAKCRPRPHCGCRTTRPALSRRWPPWLVATAAEDRLNFRRNSHG